jgi:hypothetical protein
MELIFLMVILKIPIVYLCGVIYHAIQAEPDKPSPEPAVVHVPRPRRRPPRPHAGPARSYGRTPRGGSARTDRVRRG